LPEVEEILKLATILIRFPREYLIALLQQYHPNAVEEIFGNMCKQITEQELLQELIISPNPNIDLEEEQEKASDLSTPSSDINWNNLHEGLTDEEQEIYDEIIMELEEEIEEKAAKSENATIFNESSSDIWSENHENSSKISQKDQFEKELKNYEELVERNIKEDNEMVTRWINRGEFQENPTGNFKNNNFKNLNRSKDSKSLSEINSWIAFSTISIPEKKESIDPDMEKAEITSQICPIQYGESEIKYYQSRNTISGAPINSLDHQLNEKCEMGIQDKVQIHEIYCTNSKNQDKTDLGHYKNMSGTNETNLGSHPLAMEHLSMLGNPPDNISTYSTSMEEQQNPPQMAQAYGRNLLATSIQNFRHPVTFDITTFRTQLISNTQLGQGMAQAEFVSPDAFFTTQLGFGNFDATGDMYFQLIYDQTEGQTMETVETLESFPLLARDATASNADAHRDAIDAWNNGSELPGHNTSAISESTIQHQQRSPTPLFLPSPVSSSDASIDDVELPAGSNGKPYHPRISELRSQTRLDAFVESQAHNIARNVAGPFSPNNTRFPLPSRSNFLGIQELRHSLHSPNLASWTD
jgi:hypothetical protein